MDIELGALRELFRKAPFMADLGVEPVLGAEGRIHTVLRLAPRHLQHTGQVHAAGGDRLVCEARVVKPGRSISFTEADVYWETAGKPRVHVARASATTALTRQPMVS